MHQLFIIFGVCWDFFFAKQYNKCASLRFLLAVWNCFICTPCISSPSKKAEGASRMSEASKQLQAYMTTPLVDPPAPPPLFTVAFSFPLHPSVLWVSGGIFTLTEARNEV